MVKYFRPYTQAPKFSTHMLDLVVIKICQLYLQIKLIESVVGVSYSLRVPIPASRVSGSQFQGPGCQDPLSQGGKSQVPRFQFQRLRVLSPRVPGARVSGSTGPRMPGLGSRVSGPDFRLRISICSSCTFHSNTFHSRTFFHSYTFSFWNF